MQHPPFYYALLTPFYLLSERWSLAGQFALLRGLSYFAAWLSLCLAVFVAAKTFPDIRHRTRDDRSASAMAICFPWLVS